MKLGELRDKETGYYRLQDGEDISEHETVENLQTRTARKEGVRTMILRPICRTCLFWRSRDIQGHPEWGECHRWPPQAILQPYSDNLTPDSLNYGDLACGAISSDEYGSFPNVNDDNWCGEHQERR
jgi:hypothetical protein